MQLVRDVLDKKIVDCNDREMGRVDGLLIEFPDDGQPRIQPEAVVPRRSCWRRVSRTGSCPSRAG